LDLIDRLSRKENLGVIGDPQQKKKTKVDNAKKEMKMKGYMHAPVQKKNISLFQ
jgi:hypothetical protein